LIFRDLEQNGMTSLVDNDPVPAIGEQTATGETAEIFADIRSTLDVEVVNLIWRHLATFPGALQWVWASLKPLYLGPAIVPADNIRKTLTLPRLLPLSRDTLRAAGLDVSALSSIRAILDSYQHTNALALVCFSAFLARFQSAEASKATPFPVDSDKSYVPPSRVALPRLISLTEMHPSLANLIYELNGFGEDGDAALVASMYRHLAHWPTYLALVRTMLVPLQESGELQVLVAATRRIGDSLGAALAGELSTTAPRSDIEPVLHAVRRFVRHPIARMTGVCALIGCATPRVTTV
jgi:hypothetical protein